MPSWVSVTGTCEPYPPLAWDPVGPDAECAAGRERTFRRGDEFAGLDWLTPCERPVDTKLGVLDLGVLGRYTFCSAHGHVVWHGLAEALVGTPEPDGPPILSQLLSLAEPERF